MRCEGADNPPCRRCRHAGLECLFEKPTREATLTGEAGLESVDLTLWHITILYLLYCRRIRSLEAHVAEIRFTQSAIQSTLLEIVGHLRGATPYNNRSPSTFSQTPYNTQSPTIQSMGSPPMSSGPNGSHVGDPGIHSVQAGPTTPTAYHPNVNHGSLPPMLNAPPRHSRSSISQGALASVVQPPGHGEYHPPQLPPPHTNPTSPTQSYGYSPSGQVLPPFSTLQAIGRTTSQVSIPGRHDSHQQRQMQRGHNVHSPSGSKRTAPSSSHPTSADSTDIDDDNGELPASGLVAPWEVLRGLADVAIERAAKVSDICRCTPIAREPLSRTGKWRRKQ